jgi:succinate dehydrogenase / fumarate reductase cytochrome b subunit
VGWVVALYLVGLVALAFHLYHGTWAAFRTLGLARHGEPLRRPWAWVAALCIAGGFMLIPLAVLAGVLH